MFYLFILVSATTCGHFLGMRDGFIEDFQLTSSSEAVDSPARAGRPGDVGWCPNFDNPSSASIEFFTVRTIRQTV